MAIMRASIVSTWLLINFLTTVSASPAPRERFPSSVAETAAAEFRTLVSCTLQPVVKQSFPATLLF